MSTCRLSYTRTYTRSRAINIIVRGVLGVLNRLTNSGSGPILFADSELGVEMNEEMERHVAYEMSRALLNGSWCYPGPTVLHPRDIERMEAQVARHEQSNCEYCGGGKDE
jgi:hypothetical protein